MAIITGIIHYSQAARQTGHPTGTDVSHVLLQPRLMLNLQPCNVQCLQFLQCSQPPTDSVLNNNTNHLFNASQRTALDKEKGERVGDPDKTKQKFTENPEGNDVSRQIMN